MKLSERILNIIDYVLPKNPTVYQKLLDFAKEISIGKVNLVIIENHNFFEFLESNSFAREGRHFIPIVHRNGDIADEDRFMDFRNYYFTMGNIDIF